MPFPAGKSSSGRRERIAETRNQLLLCVNLLLARVFDIRLWSD
jgi:hypothetical protein